MHELQTTGKILCRVSQGVLQLENEICSHGELIKHGQAVCGCVETLPTNKMGCAKFCSRKTRSLEGTEVLPWGGGGKFRGREVALDLCLSRCNLDTALPVQTCLL